MTTPHPNDGSTPNVDPGATPGAAGSPTDPDAPGPARAGGGNTLSIIAIVLGVVAILVLPIVFGIAAIVCAVVAKTRNERLSTIALVVAIVGTVAGFALGALVFTAQT